MMRISFDWEGCYLEHKEYFDIMAKALQEAGHEIGILTGERESKKQQILDSLGFSPNFLILWGEYETIGNASKWKVQQMIDYDIVVHYDDDARDLKIYTGRSIIKVMRSADPEKF